MARSRKRSEDDDNGNEEQESQEEEYEDEDEEESEESESEEESEEKPSKRSKKHTGGKSSSSRKRHKRTSADGDLNANKAAACAMEQLAELTCHEALSATAVEPTEDGWNVEVEVLEERRIPSTADLLSLYSVVLDEQGDLLSYRRVKRYARNRSDGSGGC
ncbi:gas vesicle protein [Stackebrandtia soli]|uniref:gas vesicle protein GvpO n=1 Tax=Stackebrandtia soli TaxID=1892856 RepID=UPI0039E9E4E8